MKECESILDLLLIITFVSCFIGVFFEWIYKSVKDEKSKLRKAAHWISIFWFSLSVISFILGIVTVIIGDICIVVDCWTKGRWVMLIVIIVGTAVAFKNKLEPPNSDKKK